MTVSPPQWNAVRPAPSELSLLSGDFVADQQVGNNDTIEVASLAGDLVEPPQPDSNKDGPPSVEKSTTRPVKWHGGKQSLASWIISLMPPRVEKPNKPSPEDPGWLHYVEPFCGGSAVLFGLDPDGISEVVNDLHSELTNFWDVLKSPEQFPQLEHWLRNTPCSQIEFERSAQGHKHPDPVVRAGYFFVRNRQCRQATARCFATMTRNRTRRGMNDLPSAWLSAIDGLAGFHARLKRVVILNKDACDVIRQQDGPRTLCYVDPPYLHETRSTTGEYGSFEMTEDDHRRLLETLAEIEGRFLLSGYRSALYDEFASERGWSRHEREVDLKSSSKKEKERRTECVWTNY